MNAANCKNDKDQNAALQCESIRKNTTKNVGHDFSNRMAAAKGRTRRRSLSLKHWIQCQNKRSMSLPDLKQLGNEWHLYQTSGLDTIKPCQLQVDLLNIRTERPLKRPLMRIKMGAIKYLSSRATQATGDWNEGFVFVVSYHAQLFNTIEFDLYDVVRKHWPKGIQHVGKAKLKISRLKGRQDVFTTFLPLYEYTSKRRQLPPDTTELIEHAGMFKKAVGTLFGDAKLFGSIQVRIRYKFQDPSEAAAITVKRWKDTLDSKELQRVSPNQDWPRGLGSDNAEPDIMHPLEDPSSSTSSSSPSLISSRKRPTQHTVPSTTTLATAITNQNNLRPPSQASFASATFGTNDINPCSQHGRGDLARDDAFVNEIFKNQLKKLMTVDMPDRTVPDHTDSMHQSISTSTLASFSSLKHCSLLQRCICWGSGSKQRKSHRVKLEARRRRWRQMRQQKQLKQEQQKRRQNLEQQDVNKKGNKKKTATFDWLSALMHPNRDLHSARGRRYGFQQNDIDGDDQDLYHQGNDATDYVNIDRPIEMASSSPPDFSPMSQMRPQTTPSASTPIAKSKKDKEVYNKEHGTAYRLTKKAKKKAKHIISSVDFGDKNFGSRWMMDSFEEVALSHPVADRLIGLAVKTQTQALVRAIIILANSFGQGFKVTAFQLIKAMLLLERFYSSLPKQIMTKEIKDRYIIDAANHYFRYALVAYGWRGLAYLGLYGQLIRRSGGKSRSNRLAILNYLRMEASDLLGYEYGIRVGAAFQPSYFVAVDRPRRSIVLSIRGTWSLYDAITDLVCYYVPWRGGLVHSGMLASAQWFFIHIVSKIFRYIHLHQKSINRFVITGHSLGGGAASLLTMMVADQMKTLRTLANNDDFQLQCYSYAPVALVSYDLACRYDQYIQSFIVQDDIVGRLSYGTAIKLKELILDTISSYQALGGMAKVLTNKRSRKLCFDIIEKCRTLIFQPATDAPPVLYIPGTIIHIRRRRVKRFGGTREGQAQRSSTSSSMASEQSAHMSKRIPGASRCVYSAHLGNRQICEEMIVTKTAILDHTIGAYQDAFTKLSAMYPANFIG